MTEKRFPVWPSLRLLPVFCCPTKRVKLWSYFKDLWLFYLCQWDYFYKVKHLLGIMDSCLLCQCGLQLLCVWLWEELIVHSHMDPIGCTKTHKGVRGQGRRWAVCGSLLKEQWMGNPCCWKRRSPSTLLLQLSSACRTQSSWRQKGLRRHSSASGWCC